MIRATFETPNYLFEAFGETECECLCLLHDAWYRHSDATGADVSYLKDYECDVWYTEIKSGEVYER
jgi:hypothetical protein